MTDHTTKDCDYLRAALVTSEHPGKPLDGTVVSMSTSHEVSIEEPFFSELIEQANERFEIDSYANGLRLATVYIDASTRDLVGVQWEASPRPYDHGDFDKPVESLPDKFMTINIDD